LELVNSTLLYFKCRLLYRTLAFSILNDLNTRRTFNPLKRWALLTFPFWICNYKLFLLNFSFPIYSGRGVLINCYIYELAHKVYIFPCTTNISANRCIDVNANLRWCFWAWVLLPWRLETFNKQVWTWIVITTLVSSWLQVHRIVKLFQYIFLNTIQASYIRNSYHS